VTEHNKPEVREMYVKHDDSSVVSIVKAAFPSYSGRTVRLKTLTLPMSVRSYWGGGSRDYYAFVRLGDKKTAAVHSNHPAFEPSQPSEVTSLPPGVVIVEHSIFCGKDHGITIYARPEDLNPALLAAPMPELSDDEKNCLDKTCGLKNSYGGESNIRFKRSGMTLERWEAAKASLLAKGFINKAGAATNEGRNANSQLRGY
jgi:hypothetical protein